MADNVAVTAGSGTTIATQDRSGVHIQQVLDTGSDAIAADDVSVTTTSGQVVAARANRKSLTILASPDNTADVYVGASGVDAATPANGFRLQAGASITLSTVAAVHADAVSGTQTIYYVETYEA